MKKFLTFGDVYQIFGYHRVPDYELAFSKLIFEIAPRSYLVVSKYPLDSSSEGLEAVPVPDLYKAKDELPKYLGKGYCLSMMTLIDSQMKAIKRLYTKLSTAKWYQFGKKLRIAYKIKFLCAKTIDIQKVFNYLEYRAKTGLYLSMQKDFVEFARKCKAEPAFSI